MKLPKMQDMSIDKTAPESMGVPCALGEYENKYPYGLCIQLGDAELEKLGLTNDCEVGELIHLFCMAKVVSVSRNESESGGERNNVSLQICFMSAEDESEENQEEDAEEEGEDKPAKTMKKGRKNLYF